MKGKRYLVSAKEMKQYDENTITWFKMPPPVLMERAALAVVCEIEKLFRPGSRVLIAAGCGNNGGDGIAVGRILLQRGYMVTVLLAGDREKCSAETERQIGILEKYGCPVQSKTERWEYDIIVDALFGTGLSRKIEGGPAGIVARMNESGAFVCAVDIPSGICADTGEIMGTAVKADMTVTFAFEKRGHILYPGCGYTGTLVCADIGITKESFMGTEPEVYAYRQPVWELMPDRTPDGNKGTFGKVLVIAGSINMSGACELCARSVYRMGAGMVKIITAEENREIVQRNIPEAMFGTRLSDRDMEWADCIVIGPGIGRSETSAELLRQVLTKSEKPLVIDADGLNLLAESEELRGYLERAGEGKLTGEGKPAGGEVWRPVILTPHLGEFVRLYGCTVAEARRDLLTKPKELADRYHCIVVCKDARTAAASWRDTQVYLNTTGNDGMATAGMGDVLAGMIGGLLSQGMEPEQAAALGVYAHGAAGDRAAQKKGRYALMAGDVIAQLEKITDARTAERFGLQK